MLSMGPWPKKSRLTGNKTWREAGKESQGGTVSWGVVRALVLSSQRPSSHLRTEAGLPWLGTGGHGEKGGVSARALPSHRDRGRQRVWTHAVFPNNEDRGLKEANPIREGKSS